MKDDEHMKVVHIDSLPASKYYAEADAMIKRRKELTKKLEALTEKTEVLNSRIEELEI